MPQTMETRELNTYPSTAGSLRSAEQVRQLLSGRAASRIPTALVVLAMPFVRPNILGESRQSVIGLALLTTAAWFAVVIRRIEGADGRRSASDPAVPLVVSLGLAYLWLLIQAAATDPGPLTSPAIQGTFLTVGSVLALIVICRDPRSRLAVGRAFVLVIAALCASFVVTAALWALAGVGFGAVAAIPIGTLPPQPLYFPFTPTESVQTVLGTEFPRFTGLGREPGWMAMYCAIAYFMADMVGLRSRWLKLLLVAGLIGCISTAGFGVFVVAWAYHLFMRDRGTGISPVGYFRQIFGLIAMAGAIWVATTAPVLGLSAKATQNKTSLNERQLATEAGIRALFNSPLGGPETEVQGGINLIADIAVSGLPFVLLICAAVLLPMIVRGAQGRYSNAVIVIVFLTLLVSQPAKDSTWVFAVVALAASLRRPDMEPLVPALHSIDRRSSASRTSWITLAHDRLINPGGR